MVEGHSARVATVHLLQAQNGCEIHPAFLLQTLCSCGHHDAEDQGKHSPQPRGATALPQGCRSCPPRPHTFLGCRTRHLEENCAEHMQRVSLLWHFLVEASSFYGKLMPALMPAPQMHSRHIFIESNGYNGETIRKLDNITSQIMRLLKRIANKHSGMKEGNLLRLVQAFVISRIVYVASYLRWYSSERYKLDCLIRKIYKQAIGLSITTSNDKLLQLGLHNTLDELIGTTHSTI